MLQGTTTADFMKPKDSHERRRKHPKAPLRGAVMHRMSIACFAPCRRILAKTVQKQLEFSNDEINKEKDQELATRRGNELGENCDSGQYQIESLIAPNG